MSRCQNKSCSKDITGVFRRSRKCLKCQGKFCSSCFMPLLKPSSKLKIEGYCNNCYIQENPENLSYPKYIGTDIPSRRFYEEYLQKYINPVNSDPLLEFSIINLIGEGSTANVYKVINSQNKVYALKQIKVSLSQMTIFEEFSKSVLSPSENVVACYCLYNDNGKYSMLLEYMDMDLYSFLKIWDRQNENVMAYILREIVKGVQYTHCQFNIHRDLKSENVFVNDVGQVKIGDFGLCAQLYKENDVRETVAGSPLWNAPEVLKGKKYSYECDVWSIGIIAFELFDLNPPNSDCKNLLELIMRIDNNPVPELPQKFSEPFREFVRCCLQKDPAMRKTSNELLETEFLQNVNEISAQRMISSIARDTKK